MKFHPCKVRCLGALPQADLAPRGLWVHAGSSSGGHDRWHRAWTRALPAEQGVVFWAPQLSSGWRGSPLSFQKGWEGHGAGLGMFYRTRGTPYVWVSGKTEHHGLWGQKAPSPHFPRQWEEHRPGHQSLRVLDSGPNNVTMSWNAQAILFPAGLSFSICKMSRLDSGIFQTVHWGDLKISQNLSQSLFHVFDSQGCPFPSPLFLTSLSVLQTGFSDKILFGKRVLRLKMFENLSGLFWSQECSLHGDVWLQHPSGSELLCHALVCEDPSPCPLSSFYFLLSYFLSHGTLNGMTMTKLLSRKI